MKWNKTVIPLLLIAITTLAQQTGLVGTVVGITDGDTLTVLDADKRQHKIRLEGIDAPESNQPFGTQAKKALSGKAFGKTVRVQITGTDKYGRSLGYVFVGKNHVNQELVNEGFAWHYKQYNGDPDLAAAENAAKSARRGLWRDDVPQPPWDFRNPKKGGETTPVGTVFVTASGDRYHREGCRSLAKSKKPMSLVDAKKSGYQPCKLCNPSD